MEQYSGMTTLIIFAVVFFLFWFAGV